MQINLNLCQATRMPRTRDIHMTHCSETQSANSLLTRPVWHFRLYQKMEESITMLLSTQMMWKTYRE